MKDETAQSEDLTSQTDEQKAEHDRRMKVSAERNAQRAKETGEASAQRNPAAVAEATLKEELAAQAKKAVPAKPKA